MATCKIYSLLQVRICRHILTLVAELSYGCKAFALISFVNNYTESNTWQHTALS